MAGHLADAPGAVAGPGARSPGLAGAGRRDSGADVLHSSGTTTGGKMSSSLPLADPAYRRALGDDLILRWSTARDVEHLASLYAQVYRDEPNEPPGTHAL